MIDEELKKRAWNPEAKSHKVPREKVVTASVQARFPATQEYSGASHPQGEASPPDRGRSL